MMCFFFFFRKEKKNESTIVDIVGAGVYFKYGMARVCLYIVIPSASESDIPGTACLLLVFAPYLEFKFQRMGVDAGCVGA